MQIIRIDVSSFAKSKTTDDIFSHGSTLSKKNVLFARLIKLFSLNTQIRINQINKKK